MADVPDGIVLKRHRDLDGMRETLWPRRIILGAIVAFAVLGLFNVFGQRPVTASADAAEASLRVYAPDHLRGGLLFSARFHITAHRDVKDATLLLGQGWAEGMSINTIEPGPVGEASRNGDLALDLGHIPAGQSYLLFLQLQVNPTNVGRRPQRVQLYDGDTLLTTIDRTITIFP